MFLFFLQDFTHVSYPPSSLIQTSYHFSLNMIRMIRQSEGTYVCVCRLSVNSRSKHNNTFLFYEKSRNDSLPCPSTISVANYIGRVSVPFLTMQNVSSTSLLQHRFKTNWPLYCRNRRTHGCPIHLFITIPIVSEVSWPKTVER